VNNDGPAGTISGFLLLLGRDARWPLPVKKRCSMRKVLAVESRQASWLDCWSSRFADAGASAEAVTESAGQIPQWRMAERTDGGIAVDLGAADREARLAPSWYYYCQPSLTSAIQEVAAAAKIGPAAEEPGDPKNAGSAAVDPGGETGCR
jgi:hypothetical protein